MASIFVSHSSQDNETAADLSRRLKEHGYDSLFLDFDPDSGIKGGRDWERELYRNLKLARAVVVLCSPSSMASRWCFVEIAQAKALGKAIFPITISPCRVESILNDRQVIDLTAVGADEAYRRLFDGLRAAGLDPGDSFDWDPKRPPFPGLNYFGAQDAGIYFGREDEIRQVIETLTRLRRQGEPRLLVVVGSSGCGKSSLVRAGVLPRLGKDRSSWALVDPFRPGAEPIGELARSLFSAFPEGPFRPDWKAIRDRLRDEFRSANPDEVPAALKTSALTEYADDLTMLLVRREASMLLVVDQAEELLQGGAGDEASAFLHVLRRATERPGGRVFGLLTLRSDFLGSFQNHPALRGVAFADLPLGLLPVENFPQVIEGPADRAEIALEPGLVRSMIADARTDDALPLLAFTLREMYERCRDQERLTFKVYRDDLGGIKGAVAHVVERIKAEGAWTPEVGGALRRAFLKLVRVNDEGQFTRQTCRWADLPDLAAPVLEAFVKARLLSSDGDVVEVTHESLFRVWPELAGWLDEGRELMLWRKNLQDEVEDWIAHDHSPLYLLSGARVAEGRRWLGSNADDFPGPEAEFIVASIAAEDERTARERAQQQKLRWLASCLAVAAVVASLFGAYAFQQRNVAIARARAALTAENAARTAALRTEHQKHVADAQRLAAQSQAALFEFPQRALLLGAEAVRFSQRLGITETRAPEQSLSDASRLTSGHVVARADGPIDHLVLTPNENRLITESGKTVHLWNLREPSQPPIVLAGHTGAIMAMALSDDGKRLITGSVDTTARVWNLEEPRQAPIVLKGHKKRVDAVGFSPDGKRAATASDDNTVALWNLVAQPPKAAFLRGYTWPVTDVLFTPDGKRLVTTTWVGSVVLWDLDPAKRSPEVWRAHGGTIRALRVTRDGKRLVTAGMDKTAKVWNLDAPAEKPIELRGHSQAVGALALTRDGKRLITGSADGAVRVWNLDSPDRPAAILSGHDDDIKAIALTPDEKRVVTVSQDRTARVWYLAAPDEKPVVLRGHESAVGALAIAADGKRLFTASFDHTARLWNLKRPTQEPIVIDPGQTGYTIEALALTPDRKWLVTGGFDKLARIWRPDTLDEAPIELRGHEGSITALIITRDGTRLVTASQDTTARIWRLDATDQKPVILKGHTGPIRELLLTRDGKRLITGSVDKTARIWSLENPEQPPVVLGPGPQKINALGLSSDENHLVTTEVNSEKTALVWNLEAPERHPTVLEGHTEPISAIALTPRGNRLITGGRDKTVRIWNLQDLRQPAEILRGHDGRIIRLAVTPDANRLLSLDDEHTVRIWSLEHPAAAPIVLPRFPVYPYALGILSAGTRLAVVDQDGRTTLWDLNAPSIDPVSLYSPPRSSAAQGYLPSVLFDEDVLVTGDSAGRICFWHLGSAALVQRASLTAGRNFTVAEWAQFFAGEPYRPVFLEQPFPAYDPAYSSVARNLSRSEWNAAFPGQPYRRTFPDRPDAED